MKAIFAASRLLSFGLLLALLTLFTSGCKSTPKVDWNSRIGTFTYDQAVAELGPPDKFATLSDGKMVADWITPSRSSFSFGLGAGSGGVGVGQSVSTGFPDKVFRLTFDQDNKLLSWSKN
jgi:hypothetical protein